MKTSEALREARKRIERGWTKGAFARNVHGDVVPSDFASAVRWCSYGAIESTCSSVRASIDPLNTLEEAVHENVIKWNDSRESAAEVLEGFDRAIALAESRGD